MLKTFRSAPLTQTAFATLALAFALNAAPKKSEAAVAMIAIPPLAGATTAGIVIGATTGGLLAAMDITAITFAQLLANGLGNGRMDGIVWGLGAFILVLDSPDGASSQLEAALSQKYSNVATADRTVIRDLSKSIVARMATTPANEAGNKLIKLTHSDFDAALEASDLVETASPATRAQLEQLKHDLM